MVMNTLFFKFHIQDLFLNDQDDGEVETARL